MKQENTIIQKRLNEIVFEGKLPIAFFNSVVIKNKNITTKNYKKLNKKYMQTDIPRGYNDLVISKIYEIS